jgi:hypothetical protein
MTPKNEVQSALKVRDARDVGGVRPIDAEDVLRQRYQILQDLSTHKSQAVNLSREVGKRIEVKTKQLNHTLCMLSQKAAEESVERQQRRNEIYRHVSQHLRDVKDLCDMRREEALQATNELSLLIRTEQELDDQIGSLVRQAAWEDGARLNEMGRNPRDAEVKEDFDDMVNMF